MVEDILPIIADIPRNLAWRVDLDRHHLTETPALNQHDSGPNTTTSPASVIALLDLSRDKRIAACHISSRNDVCAFDGELPVFVCGGSVAELNEERMLADIRRHMLELKSLKPSPAQQRRMHRSELSKKFGKIFVWIVIADGLLFGGRDLGYGMLADGFVGRPVQSLTIRRAIIRCHATTTKTKLPDSGLLNDSALIA